MPTPKLQGTTPAPVNTDLLPVRQAITMIIPGLVQAAPELTEEDLAKVARALITALTR